MKKEKPPGRGPRRLQIRVSVDEHMHELFTRLQGVPAPLRGRELVALARVACGLNAVSAAFAVLRASGGLLGVSLESGVAAGHILASAPDTPSATSTEGLSEQAARRAAATFEPGFLMAVPSPE